MWKKLMATLALLSSALAFAAVDANKATVAELDSVKGIGPGLSNRILEQRKSGPFKNWDDFIARVSGVGEANAAKFSAGGLTVNGQAYTGGAKDKAAKPAAAPADAAAAKPAAKAEKKDSKS